MRAGASYDSGSRVIDEVAPPQDLAKSLPRSVMSAATAEHETEAESPKSFDPMMAAPAPGAPTAKSFSDMDELPPMKEPVFAPPPPPLEVPQVSDPSPLSQLRGKRDDKPKIQPREVAEKAIKEIKTVPPQLMIYSILGAILIIMIVAVAVYFHVRSEDDDSTAAPRPTKTINKAIPPAPTQSAPAPVATPPIAQAEPAAVIEPEPEVTVRQIDKRPANSHKRAPAPVAVVPGSVQIDSTPQGAQIQLDGRGDPAWITPFSLSGLSPGRHTISVSKSGFSADARTIDIASGSRSNVSIHLAPINALMVVNSTPTGADVILDGKSTGRVTPIQFAVEKGTHTLVLRKQGYLDETANADLSPGQNFQFAPALRALGNADDIRSVGKFKKMFGGGGDSVAGMGSISVRTQPKGAQIAINQRLLDKGSPTEFMLGPGNYVVDITLTGFKPVHKVVGVEKGGKVAIDEILERQ
jgi:hypothetical protein